MAIVYQVKASQFDVARSLFDAAGVSFDRPYWEAAFDGRVASRLFVDDLVQPTGAILTRTYDFFLAGTASPTLLALLRDASPETQLYQWFYGFVPLTDDWREALLATFPDLFTVDRRAFRLSDGGFHQARDWTLRTPDGVRIVPLDAELALRADVEIPEVISILWDGYDAFVRGGWGYAAIDAGGRMLSTAYACGLTDREVNLGVGTARIAGRRGLAKLVCQVCITHADQNGLAVTWDCDRPNEASGKLAESLGFVEEESFIELAFPERDVPSGNPGLWTAQSLHDGIVRWEK